MNKLKDIFGIVKETKYTILVTNDGNGHEHENPYALLVDIYTEDNQKQIRKWFLNTELTRAGVMRMGGDVRYTVEHSGYSHKLRQKGRLKDFPRSSYDFEYRVVSGNY